MDDDERDNGEPRSSSLLFPLSSPAQHSLQPHSHWLCNSSFYADASLINHAAFPKPQSDDDDDEEDDSEQTKTSSVPSVPTYRPVESSDSGEDARQRREKKKKTKKMRRREKSDERGRDDFGSRSRSKLTALGSSAIESKSSKDFFFDSNGDRDNLVFGSLYRMDVARYKPYIPEELSGLDLHRWSRGGSSLDRDGDVEALDNKLRSGGRYWSAKYMALESQKNLKRTRVLVLKSSEETNSDNFVPLLDAQASVVEESWDDEVLRKTREFNMMTRERPHDERVWLDFSEFQDKVAAKVPQKGARLQILEKKISILEKAVELNRDNEELLLVLLKSYQSRDSTDALISRWEKILMQNSGSYKLWREFLRFVQGEFSKFKVSELRKMYSNAIQALSAACSRHSRQAYDGAASSLLDSALVQQELGLVDIFLCLCRFEWQSGYQELATALFQAEIEFSLFCPSLSLTEHSKQRLFQHFWESNGARVGEEGAFGWSTWLEKEEENRQRALKEEASREAEERGSWTGWSEPFANNKMSEAKTEMEVDQLHPESETDDVELEDDTEALLKKLGIDIDASSSGEVKDTSTWIRWSNEEQSRDCDQWMPVREKCGVKSSPSDGPLEVEGDDHLLRAVMYEDVNEFVFSLSSFEARSSLLSQFVEFFGGRIPQRICSNNSSWIEKALSMEELSDSLLHTLRKVHDFSNLEDDPSKKSLEILLGINNDTARRIEMMKFLRNATLLCLTAFPRDYVLEEAALVAEELSVTHMNSVCSSVTPCRRLAKHLLKADRQDILLCGVYARREASHGNIDHARRVFDMALSSIEGLPSEQKSLAPLLYFWYVETELANDPRRSHESSVRAMHILSCLGNGETYCPFKGQPTSLQLLKAHQGFKEKIRAVRSAWVCGVICDQSVSVVCSAALFEELTSGPMTGVQVLDQAFSMVLPERRSRSYEMEFLFEFYVRMLQRCGDQSKCWDAICEGLQIFPYNADICSALVQIGHLYRTSNKLRWIFDDYCQKKKSVILWIFALSFEMSRGGSQHRICGLFERALGMQNSVLIWRCYIAYKADVACDPSGARRVFFRAIHACPWSKKVWMDGFRKLNAILSPKELSDLQEVMRDKELNLRTDIYEILLQHDSTETIT